ncbi:MAG: hypothetical protein FJ135_07410 [Deltaproteobacteria bacterium]|nr:hypothetical protein [Deltaproteobacteria bacterium]
MNSKKIVIGTILLVTFFLVLIAIFMPWYGPGVTGKPRNGLEFSDDFFNSLAKGSSNFMDNMRQLATPFKGQVLDVHLKSKDAPAAQKKELLFTKAGATVTVEGDMAHIKGDLGQIMFAAIDDSDTMFHNQDEKIKAAYGIDGRTVLRTWWVAFKELDHALKAQEKFKEARVVSEIMMRSIEPGYNFFGISPERVRDNIGMLTFMLVFYVVYTLWYGYGVFELFEGIGMGAHAGHKEEV